MQKKQQKMKRITYKCMMIFCWSNVSVSLSVLMEKLQQKLFTKSSINVGMYLHKYTCWMKDPEKCLGALHVL